MRLQTSTLTDRIAALEAEAAAKDAFVAALSRELSNPMAPVLLAVERLRSVLAAGDPARTETALQLLERAIKAYDRRTKVLLTLADITAGMAPPPPEEVDIAELLAAAVDRHAEIARRAGCTIRIEAGAGLVAAAHADSLAQVLDYLLANAFRFGAGRPVSLTAQAAPPGHVTIAVADQGPGLGPDEAARVFRLYSRPRFTLEPGLGVGLWVAGQLVTAMGGRIRVESVPGQGAQFYVTLAACEN